MINFVREPIGFMLQVQSEIRIGLVRCGCEDPDMITGVVTPGFVKEDGS